MKSSRVIAGPTITQAGTPEKGITWCCQLQLADGAWEMIGAACSAPSVLCVVRRMPRVPVAGRCGGVLPASFFEVFLVKPT